MSIEILGVNIMEFKRAVDVKVARVLDESILTLGNSCN